MAQKHSQKPRGTIIQSVLVLLSCGQAISPSWQPSVLFSRFRFKCQLWLVSFQTRCIIHLPTSTVDFYRNTVFKSFHLPLCLLAPSGLSKWIKVGLILLGSSRLVLPAIKSGPPWDSSLDLPLVMKVMPPKLCWFSLILCFCRSMVVLWTQLSQISSYSTFQIRLQVGTYSKVSSLALWRGSRTLLNRGCMNLISLKLKDPFSMTLVILIHFSITLASCMPG